MRNMIAMIILGAFLAAASAIAANPKGGSKGKSKK